MMKNIQECKFCNLDSSIYYNTILEESDNFYVIPSVGSLVDGYILIVSKKHCNNMLELDLKSKEEYYDLIYKYREIFKKIYNKYPIVFEHGSSNVDNLSASSIVHAHTHIVNHKFLDEDKIILELKFKKISICNYNTNRNFKSYIYYINPGNQTFISFDFKPKSQLIRYYIAQDLNLIKKYDWNKYIGSNNIKSTIKKIKNY